MPSHLIRICQFRQFTDYRWAGSFSTFLPCFFAPAYHEHHLQHMTYPVMHQ